VSPSLLAETNTSGPIRKTEFPSLTALSYKVFCNQVGHSCSLHRAGMKEQA
jgi:hypothetical protein